MRLSQRLILYTLILALLALSASFTFAQEAGATEEAVVTEEAAPADDTDIVGEGSLGGEGNVGVEAQTAAESEEAAEEAQTGGALELVMLVLGLSAVAIAGYSLMQRDQQETAA